MAFELLQAGPLRRLLLQAVADKVLEVGPGLFGELEIEGANFLLRRSIVLGLERRLANNELVRQDAQAPYVHALVVAAAIVLDHLRRQVVQCATHGLSAVRWGVDAPTVVRQLDDAEAVQQILWLDVPVDYVLRVDVLQSLYDLVDISRGDLLCIATLGLSLQILV